MSELTLFNKSSQSNILFCSEGKGGIMKTEEQTNLHTMIFYIITPHIYRSTFFLKYLLSFVLFVACRREHVHIS